MSDRCSAVLEGSILALNEPDIESSGNANQTHTGDESSPDIGPKSHAMRTFVRSTQPHGPHGSNLDDERWEEATIAPPATVHSATQRALISSAEDSPAKISPSQDDEQDSTGSDPACSSSSLESLTLFSPRGDGCLLRTYPDSFPQRVGEISESFSRRWPNSGFTTSRGECWTADTSECPSGGGAYSSLRDVLEADVHPRFYLSPKAATGILRRAEKRGRRLPEELRTALQAHLADATEAMNWTATEPISSPARSQQNKDGMGKSKPSFTSQVRRLTPTEYERLQGFPDGWTVALSTRVPTDPDTQPVGTP